MIEHLATLHEEVHQMETNQTMTANCQNITSFGHNINSRWTIFKPGWQNLHQQQPLDELHLVAVREDLFGGSYLERGEQKCPPTFRQNYKRSNLQP